MATPRLASVQLAGADGGPLRADVRVAGRPGERRPAVIICHGFKGFKDWGFFPKLAERLGQAGFLTISFNFSGSGVAEGDQFTELDRWGHHKPSVDLQDIGTVVDYAEEQGASWIGLVGHSRGGGLAILHASRDPRVRALVTWAAIDHFLRFSDADLARWRHEGKLDIVNARTGQVLPLFPDALDDVERHQHSLLDIVGAAGRLTQPWLIVHGAADATVPAHTAERLAAASGRAQMLSLEGADHTFGIKHPWGGSTPAFDRVLDATVGFLSEHLA